MRTERTKQCPRCQIVKPWSDYHPQVKWEDGTMRRPRSRCKACNVEDCREWRHANGDVWRTMNNRNVARHRANPENRAVKRDRDRIYRRQRFAIPPSRWRTPTSLGPSTRPDVVPVGPFADWLATLDATPAAIARACGISERRVYGVLKGEQERVELDTVDRALQNYGGPLTVDDLYAMGTAA